MRLEDLRVVTGHAPDTRPATLEELVEVLKQEGAVEHVSQWSQSWMTNFIEVQPGRYLVLPLEDTP